MASSRSLVFLLALLASPLALAVDSDFSGLYPDGALDCLNKASDQSKCNGAASNVALNKCLCSNTGDFIVSTAQCLGQEANDLVKRVYQIMSDACLQTETPLVISQSDFISLANGEQPSSTATSSTSTSTSTTSSSSAPTSTNDSNKNNDKDDSSISTGAIVGIAIGGVAAIAVIATFFFLHRRRRAGEESHPMLPTDNNTNMGGGGGGNPYHGATTFPPSEPSPGLTSNFDHDPKNGRYSTVSALSPGGTQGGYSPSMTNHTMTPPPGATTGSWGNGPPSWNGAQYTGAYASPPPQGVIAELPPETAPVYEMDGGSQPLGHGQYAAELSGSAPQPYQPYDSHRR